MKASILERINQLGGNTAKIKGTSLQEDILSITFNTVLYQKPTDTPWAKAGDQEPIYAIGEFIDDNKELIQKDSDALYKKIIDKYYCLTDEGYGQMFWLGELFTPFKAGTDDFEEWNSDFIDEEEVDLKVIIDFTNDPKPDFIKLFYSYGFPSGYYICLSDPNPQNPTLFGTDHTEFFRDVSNQGTLEDILNTFMSPEELIAIVKQRLAQ